MAKKRAVPRSFDPLSLGMMAAMAESPEAQHVPLAPGSDLTLRDEANAIVRSAVRGGFLEDLHAGAYSPLLDDPGLSRTTNDEMRKLMVECSAAVAQWLYVKTFFREKLGDAAYLAYVRSYRDTQCPDWDREAVHVDLIGARQTGHCPSCKKQVGATWAFCATCGVALGAAG